MDLRDALMLLMMLIPTIKEVWGTINILLAGSQPLAWLQRKLGGSYHRVDVRMEQAFCATRGCWVTNQEEEENTHIIDALMQRIAKCHALPDQVRCNLERDNIVPGAGHGSAATRMYSRKFSIVPTSEVTCDDYLLSYTDIARGANNDKSAEKRERIVTVRSRRPAADIQTFIRQSYEQYVKERYTADEAQYMYMQIPSEHGVRFKKYTMNNRLTFDRLHFPEKQKLLEMIDKFQQGKLDKLALMLHGTPGCGKTSIVKAIAKVLGYSVVTVKLSFLMSDSALMDIFHNKALMYHRNNDETFDLVTDHVALDKRVYIFEDVDAESDVIHTRSSEPSIPPPPPPSPSSQPPPPPPPPQYDNARKGKASSYVDQLMQRMLKQGLTLSGVLNVLDGVIELNGAVIIMTTNHLGKLDPAFTRPGRITLTLQLNPMRSTDAQHLAESHFGPMTIDIPDGVFTAATFEAFCQAASSAAELCEMVAARAVVKT